MTVDVSSLLNGQNGVFILLSILLIFFIIIILLKKGFIKVKTNHVEIGKVEDKERSLLRQQIEYAESACYGMKYKLPKDLGLEEYRTKYIIEKVYDEFIKIILFNHLSLDKGYIKTKQEIIRNVIWKRTEIDYFASPEFIEMLFGFVEGLIKDLYNMRYNSAS